MDVHVLVTQVALGEGTKRLDLRHQPGDFLLVGAVDAAKPNDRIGHQCAQCFVDVAIDVVAWAAVVLDRLHDVFLWLARPLTVGRGHGTKE